MVRKPITQRGWKETTVGEFCPFSYGKGLAKKVRNENGTVAVYGSNGKIGIHDNALIESAGVVIGRKGTVGAVHYSPNPFWPIDTTFYIADDSISRDIRFTYYFLKTIGLEHMNSDSAVPGLNREAVHTMKVFVPELAEQRAIARTLGALDDKIEINRQMNTTLESIAQALFQSWFINFDPVQAKSKGRPPGLPPKVANLFPSEFEDSELGIIPKGWRFVLLSDVAHISMGQSPIGSTYNKENIGLPFYQGVADFQDRYPGRRVFCTAPTRFANKGDILLSVRAPIGRINMAIERCAIGRGVAGICASNHENQGFLDIALRQKSDDWRILESQGSVFGSAKKSDISRLPILWPTPEILRIFSNIVSALIEQIEYNFKTNCALTDLRDTILPKLLSGKLRAKA